MTRMVNRVWAFGLLGLLLWAGSAQATPCQKSGGASNPDEVYIDHGDGTVTDTRTGLMWKQCAEGQSGSDCAIGSVLIFNSWADALVRAEGSTFAGYNDWRLPNVKELFSLVEDCRVLPTMNTNRFPNAPSANFWSGSPSFYEGAWHVLFDYGSVGRNARYSMDEDAGAVRFVRNGL